MSFDIDTAENTTVVVSAHEIDREADDYEDALFVRWDVMMGVKQGNDSQVQSEFVEEQATV